MNRRDLMVAGTAALLAGRLSATVSARPSEVVELRQYTLHKHRRDDLISLFDDRFIEPQEALGIRVIGQFRDMDDPDRFVWLRGFSSYAEREPQLAAFYHGPVWQAHRERANATMLDSDNVLLLRPSNGTFDPGAGRRTSKSMILIGIHYLGSVDETIFGAFFDRAMRPVIEAAGATVIGELASERRPNNFTALPVRDDRVFTWISRVADEVAMHAVFDRLRSTSGWRDGASEACLPAFMRKPEFLRLRSTSESQLG